MKDDHNDLMTSLPLPWWARKSEGHEESPPLDAIASGRWNYNGIAEEGRLDVLKDAVGLPVTPVKGDPVFRPNHYAQFWPEPITVINSWNLNFNKGNAVKYIARAGHKDAEEQDLKKAIRYLEIELECIRRRKANGEPKEIWGDTL